MFLEILLALFLVALNGFFVAAEFSIVKVRYSKIHLRAEKGNKLAKVAKSIIEHLDTYLSATQLGITLASLGLGWIGEPVVAKIVAAAFQTLALQVSEKMIHSISMPVGFLVITFLHIVFGELAPKSIAIRKSEPTTLVIAYPLKIFYFIFKPFIWLMNAISNLFLHVIGIRPVEGHEIHTDEEIQLLVEQSKNAGALEREKYEIIKNAFDFNDRTAKQIMIPRQKIFAVEIDQPAQEIIHAVIENGYSRIPVIRESLDSIAGILNAKELFQARHRQAVIVIKDLLHPAMYVFESQLISQILPEFQKKHTHIAVVVDEFGGTQGIITLEDILEELVGEIQDEGDEEKNIIEMKGGNTIIVLANISVEDINERLPVPLPESKKYVTLSGGLIEHLGRFPVQGEVIRFGEYDITVLKIEKWVIQEVQLQRVVQEIKDE
jgi:CBS domain containing-hemolysin-like protein